MNIDRNADMVRFKDRQLCSLPTDVTGQMSKYHRNRRYDIYMEEDMDQALHEESLRRARLDPESLKRDRLEQFCASIRRGQDEMLLEEKSRLQLRKSNQELIELQSKLACAESAIVLAEQKAAAAYKKIADKQAYLLESIEVREQNKRIERELREEEEIAHQKKMQYGQKLRMQMHMNREERERQQAEKLRDRQEMLKTVDRIEKQIEAEKRALQEEKIRYRKDIDAIVESQNRLQQQMASAMAAQDAKTDNWLEEREKKAQEKLEAKRQQRQRFEKWADDLRAHLKEAERRKRYNENYIQELLIDERLSRIEQKVEDRLEFEQRERMEAYQELKRFQELAKMRKDEVQQQKHREHLQMLRDLHEYNEEELKEAAELRERKKALGMLAAADIQARRSHREKLLQVEEERHKLELAAQKRFEEALEAERLRLLRLKPPKVLLYLEHGVLRESDKQHIEWLPTSERVKFP